MDIGVVDFGGNFLGPALGLAGLGHRVRYEAPGAEALEAPLAQCFVPPAAGGPFDAPLVVVAASFADEAWAAAAGIQSDAPWNPSDPLFRSINPRQRRVRDAWLEERFARVRELVLVDMSDEGEPDPWFLRHGDRRFKRECPLWVDAALEPFPFLYHPLLLRVEFLGRDAEFRVGAAEHGAIDAFFFAGTLRHWRYAGRRLRLLERARRRTRRRIVVVEEGLTQRETWLALQRHRAGLYLPGKGELCFRLHELAFFGVPSWAPFEPSIRLPDPWRAVLAPDPDALPSPEDMLRFHLEHYHPRRAAARIARTEHPLPLSA